MYKRIITTVVFSTLLLTAVAQNDCNNYLDRAKKAYDQGRFGDAITTLKNCTSSDPNEVNKWKVSRLLCQCYLGLNDMPLAKAAAEDMLEQNPIYTPSLIEDNREFVKLLNSVSVVPRFSLSLSLAAGLNISYPFVYKRYVISPYDKVYDNGKAKQFGLYGGYNFNRHLSLHAGALYTINNYKLNFTFSQFNIKYSESLNYLQAHLFARYQVKVSKKMKIFMQAGSWSGFLLQSKYSISRSDSNAVTESELLSIDNTSSRNKNILGMLTGAGISYKIGEGHIFGEVNFQKSFSIINIPDQRLENQNLISKYYYVDDDIGINNLTFSLGYTFYLNYFVERSKTKK